jgi:hypothetical protein
MMNQVAWEKWTSGDVRDGLEICSAAMVETRILELIQ